VSFISFAPLPPWVDFHIISVCVWNNFGKFGTFMPFFSLKMDDRSLALNR